MPLNAEEIRKIAGLARLKLNEAEVAAYRRDFSGILAYVDQLRGLKLPPAKGKKAAAARSAARLRSDRALAWPEAETEAALKQAPARLNGQLKTKRIL